MLNFSLMGAGRIGKMHAKFIAAHPKAKLKYIYDVNSQFAEEVAKSTEMFNCIFTRGSN